jgi:hypothetical protein
MLRGSGALKGGAGLVLTAAVVVGVLIWLPAARWFLLFAVLVGIVIALAMHLWHKHRPVKVDDYNDKRPLGLS